MSVKTLKTNMGLFLGHIIDRPIKKEKVGDRCNKPYRSQETGYSNITIKKQIALLNHSFTKLLTLRMRK